MKGLIIYTFDSCHVAQHKELLLKPRQVLLHETKLSPTTVEVSTFLNIPEMTTIQLRIIIPKPCYFHFLNLIFQKKALIILNRVLFKTGIITFCNRIHIHAKRILLPTIFYLLFKANRCLS